MSLAGRPLPSLASEWASSVLGTRRTSALTRRRGQAMSARAAFSPALNVLPDTTAGPTRQARRPARARIWATTCRRPRREGSTPGIGSVFEVARTGGHVAQALRTIIAARPVVA
jgi:hypothetical protein